MSAVNAAASNASFEFDSLKCADNYRRAIAREFTPGLSGTVVELGAGIGQMALEFSAVPGVKRFVAVEPDANFVPTLRATLPRAEVISGTLDALPADVRPDSIVSVNVFEHIEDDQGEMAKSHALLLPNRGLFCILVPARPEIYSPLDKDFGHFRRYTKDGLSRSLEKAGFKIERINYFNGIGYFAWWWVCCVRKQRTFNAGAVRFFDRVIFPPTNWLERTLIRPPVGQSLIALARAVPRS
jgi:hypothetical protein